MIDMLMEDGGRLKFFICFRCRILVWFFATIGQ